MDILGRLRHVSGEEIVKVLHEIAAFGCICDSEFRPAGHFWMLPLTVPFGSHCELPPCMNWDFTMMWNWMGRYTWEISAQSVCGIKAELILSQILSATCAGSSAPVVPVCSPTQLLVQTQPLAGAFWCIQPAVHQFSVCQLITSPGFVTTVALHDNLCVAWPSLGPRNFQLHLNTCGLSKKKCIPDMPLITLGVLGTLPRIYFYKSGSKSWFLTQTTKEKKLKTNPIT